MDVKKGKLNIIVSISLKIVTTLLAILVKRVLIDICGNDVNGLNALYISIIGVLSVAELGVGSSITFCMYKPIVDGEVDKVGALYQLFKRLYLVIGGVIFCGGLCVLPFIKTLAKGHDVLDTNIHFAFVLVLLSVTLTYLFSAKTSLINAYKNNYITTAISQGGIVLQNILQIIVLVLTRSFLLYLFCRIITVVIQYVVTEIIVKARYKEVIINKSKIDCETKHKLKKSIKAMFMHKIGGVLVNTVDSIVISTFVGVIALGEYSNYTTILSSMTGIITLLFTSLTSVIGHLCVEEDRETAKKYCECFHLINYVVGVIFFLGYYSIIDNLICLLFSSELIVSRNISFVITFNGFVQFMRYSILTFRDATGTFYGDRWKPLVEGVINITLSILLVLVKGVTGVIVATIITNLLICHIVEPYVLYKNAFSSSPQKYYLVNYMMIVVFFTSLVLLNACMVSTSNVFIELICNGLMSIGISTMATLAIILGNKKGAKNLVLLFKKGL